MSYTITKKTGIILAGGKSTRMGKDKGLMLLNKKPMVNYVLDALTGIVDKSMVVTDNKDYDKLGITRVNDAYKDCGPLSGLYSGLSASDTEINFVISCDVPLITSGLLLQLYGSMKKSIDIVICSNKHFLMPLVGIYKKSRCIEVVQALLEKGERRMQSLVGSVSTKVVALNDEANVQILNINTVEDFNRLEKKLLL